MDTCTILSIRTPAVPSIVAAQPFAFLTVRDGSQVAPNSAPIKSALPYGWRMRIHDAARRDEQNPAEWMRTAIKRALEATRKRSERAK